MFLRPFTFILLINLSFSSIVLAINIQPSNLYEHQLSVPATLGNKTLGTDLSLSGTTGAVAALSKNNLLTGSVYIYNAEENWRLTDELKSGEPADNFANRIFLINDRLVISADRDDTHGIDSGAVYIYKRDKTTKPYQWKQTAKLTAPDAKVGAQFGHAIALIDNKLYIGSPLHVQGKVYIFSQNTATQKWLLTDSIKPNDPQALRFGASIAINKQTLIIGAPYTNAIDTPNNVQPRFAISKGDTVDPGIESGAIYVYENNAGIWQQTTRLGASNRETGDHLGEQIAINNNTIVASVNQKDILDELRAGAVYTYKKNKIWNEESTLTAEPAQFGGNFGVSLSMYNDQILIGANKTHSNGFNSGRVFLFSQDTKKQWSLPHMLTNKSISAHDQFGLNVALGSEYILVASKHAAYAFQKNPIAKQTAIFYTDTNTLHLNEVNVEGVGVFSATLQLNQESESLLLSVTANYLRTGIKNSTVNYNSSGQLTIPQLAIDNGNGEIMMYSVALQKVSGEPILQFKVSSIKPL
ncbi:MAG: hypothetical protein KAH20_00515 [Methylococcales bacterium]|nr:hypothetical protein [Methylococcales bacterium]